LNIPAQDEAGSLNGVTGETASDWLIQIFVSVPHQVLQLNRRFPLMRIFS
jgi:hypothetical protein